MIRHRDRKLFLASTKRSGNPPKCVTQEGKKGLIRESFFSPVICVATHSGWLKAPDLEQMGACNQGKGILEFYSVSSGALRALCYWWEHWRTRRVCISAPFGVKGSNPLQVLWVQGRLAYYGLLMMMSDP